ncbi:MAG: type II secretion system protein [Phycisphaerales bacterium]|nr:type II secretion system protein [Phycisphaerales bacterium]
MTELVVSMGILGLMLVLVGKVFSIAVDSTNQARSLMEVSNSFRLLEETLRADLRGVDPSRSMMVIAGNAINAYWTPDGPEADDDGDPSSGYPHSGDADREVVGVGINGAPNPPWRLELPRADVLMLFTSRPATSVQYPDIKSNNTMVVWGHAELGKLNSDGTWQVDPLDYLPPVPGAPFWNAAAVFRDRYIARNWHLARRTTLLVDSTENDLEAMLGTIAGGGPPIMIEDPLLAIDPNDMGLVPPEEEFKLRDGRIDIMTTDSAGIMGLDFDGLIAEGDVITDVAPPDLREWYARSRLDPAPPAKMAGRLGHYFLPNCASVKIEWTFADPAFEGLGEVVWVDPADLDASPADPSGVVMQLDRLAGTLGLPLAVVDRLGDISHEFTLSKAGRFDPSLAMPPAGEPRTHVFYSRDPDSSASPSDPDPFFPTALRITVDMFDDGGRFQRPTRQVMVLPVGEGG